MKRMIKCPECEGKMRIKPYDDEDAIDEDGLIPCTHCEGEGEVEATSEFGKGFVYNLVLFAKHYEQWKEIEKLPHEAKEKRYSMFFYSATDHLYDMEIPLMFEDTRVGELATEFRDLCFKYRLPMDKSKEAGKEEFFQAFKILGELALEIDKALGVEPIEADHD